MDKIYIRRVNNQKTIDTIQHHIDHGVELVVEGVYCEQRKTEAELRCFLSGILTCSRHNQWGVMPCFGCVMVEFVNQEPDTFIGWE